MQFRIAGFFTILAVAVTATAHGQQPITLTIVPLGSTSPDGGEMIALEILLTAHRNIRVEGGQIDMPTSLFGLPGSSGSISIVANQAGATADPDGNGTNGPSSGGFPALFGLNGLVPFTPTTAIMALTPTIGGMPVNVPAGATRYMATFFYRVNDCAAGEFQAQFECTDVPGGICPATPGGTNTTRLREDEPPGPAQGLLIPMNLVNAVLSVPVGRCCEDSSCIGDVNETCCVSGHKDRTWDPVLRCADGCGCMNVADCDDDNGCTTDSCTNGRCQNVLDPERCDDDDDCTVDRCVSPFGGCLYDPRCLYGDLVPEEPDCRIDAQDVQCALNGFAVLNDCPVADVFPCIPDEDINFDDVLALLTTGSGHPPCADPVVCR